MAYQNSRTFHFATFLVVMGNDGVLEYACAMAGRKAAAIQLQQEVNNDEEWDALLDKRGLIVIDIFSGWCGPCVGMVANLKKIKLEIGGDILILATAKSDEVTVLERFRERSEPCWMFVSGRKIVNLMFGANAPQLMKLITQELEKEKAAQRAGRPRDGAPFTQVTPAEAQRNEYEKKRDELRRAKMEDQERQKRQERHEKDVAKLMEAMKENTVVLFLPFTFDRESKEWVPFNTLMQMLGPRFEAKEQLEIDLNVEGAKKIFNIYFDEFGQDEEEGDLVDDLKEQLVKGKCLAVMIGLKGAPTPVSVPSDPLLATAAPAAPAQPESLSDVDVMNSTYQAVYGGGEEEEEEPPPPQPVDDEEEEEEEAYEEGDEAPKSILAHLTEEYGWMTAIPGVWAPKSDREKAEATLVLFKDYSETIVGPPPPVLPPHVAIAFDARAYPDLQETLTEYEDKVLKSGFFNSHNPDTARKVADNFDELHLIARTGTEKFVIMLDNTKSEALLALAQFGPTFVSQDPDEGKEDCFKFFPEEEVVKEILPEEEGVVPGVEITEPDIVSKDDVSVDDYNPLALRESKKEETDEVVSMVSGLEDITSAAGDAEVDGEGEEGEGGAEGAASPEGEGAAAGGAEGAAEAAPPEGEGASEKPEGEAAAEAGAEGGEAKPSEGEEAAASEAAPAEGDKPAEGAEEGAAAPAEGEAAPAEEAAGA